ncbi:MAG: hypothetical protein M0Q88_07555 [Bacilli bacterium]|nr:hypothetical protein [Bacilli bacterium]
MARKKRNFWTKEKCHEISLKCKTKKEFKYFNATAYTTAYKKGWLDDICSHMDKIGNLYKRCIYVVLFYDKSAYIGLTFNYKNRILQHLSDKKSSVYKYIKKCDKYKSLKLTDYLDKNLSVKKEEEYINFFKDKGYKILNRNKAGALGSKNIIWTKSNCQKTAKKYNSKEEFRKNDWVCYQKCIKEGWLNDFCQHMIEIKKYPNYWTKEKCQIESLKYKNKSDFHKNSNSAYNVCSRNGWLDEICQHMKQTKRKHGFWSKERCSDIAFKYSDKKNFRKKENECYKMVVRKGWLKDIYNIIEKNK